MPSDTQPLLEVGTVIELKTTQPLGEFLVTRRTLESNGIVYDGKIKINGQWYAGHQWSENSWSSFSWKPVGTQPAATCPKCGCRCVQRTNRSTGKDFTGCSAWPDCNWSTSALMENSLKETSSTGSGGTMLSKTNPDIGKTIKIQTNGGAMVGTVVGKNTNSGNLILRVDKRSPVKGFKPDEDMLYTIEDYVEERYQRGIKSHTFWHFSPKDEVEEASEADLLPKGEKVKSPSVEEIKAQAKEELRAEIKANVEAEAASRFDKATEEANQKVKESTMSEKKNPMAMLKNDGHEAAYRVAGKRLSSGANKLLTKAVTGMVPAEHAATAELIMQSELGQTITKLALGWSLRFAPGPAQDARIQKLAGEFAVQGTADGMDMLVGGVLEQLTPLMNEALSMLPGGEEKTTTNARIATTSEAPPAEVSKETLAEQEEHELAEATEDAKKKAAVGQ